MRSIVRLRQTLDRVRHRLLFIPLSFVAISVGLAQLMLWVDRAIGDDPIPRALETTVGSGRAILSTIAGGLIASITLLLSLMLVAVQLGNTQFSPRTLRDWIGDRTQQMTIGIVLGTTVFCLLALRLTRSFAEGEAQTPHATVLVAVFLGVVSLIAVVRSVDHLADSLRVGSVAGRIARETIDLVRDEDRLIRLAHPAMAPVAGISPSERAAIPDEAVPVEADTSGWVQQIDEAGLMQALPEGATALLVATLGSYAMRGTPLLWVWPPPTDEQSFGEIRNNIAIGDTRTMQQDIGFGILQMVDIALRALSPGVNDPNTANDLIVHLGEVMLALWETAAGTRRITTDGRTLIRTDLDHADYLSAAFDQIRRYGAGDIDVAATMIQTLLTLRSEVARRDLPGPVAPIDHVIEQIVDTVEASNAMQDDKDRIRALIK